MSTPPEVGGQAPPAPLRVPTNFEVAKNSFITFREEFLKHAKGFPHLTVVSHPEIMEYMSFELGYHFSLTVVLMDSGSVGLRMIDHRHLIPGTFQAWQSEDKTFTFTGLRNQKGVCVPVIIFRPDETLHSWCYIHNPPLDIWNLDAVCAHILSFVR